MLGYIIPILLVYH